MRRCEPASQRGVTLVEVLVAVALLAALGGALSALQVGTLRANRAAQVRLRAADVLADEVTLQRTLAGASLLGSEGAVYVCAFKQMPEDWLCSVTSACVALPALAPCSARVFTVELRLPAGEPLTAHSASFRSSGASP